MCLIFSGTALHYASQEGHLNAVKLLLNHRAEIDAAGDDQVTPLLLASENGHLDVVQLLVASKADVNHKKKNGYVIFPTHSLFYWQEMKVKHYFTFQ